MGKVYIYDIIKGEDIEFLPEMINWPYTDGETQMIKLSSFIANEITAMLEIKSFDFDLSLLVNLEEKKFYQYHYPWGYTISSEDKQEFRYIHEFPKKDCCCESIEYWSVEEWKYFLIKKIKKDVFLMVKDASNVLKKAREDFSAKKRIERTVNKLINNSI